MSIFTEHKINLLWYNHFKNQSRFESKEHMISEYFERGYFSEETKEPVYHILRKYKPDFIPKNKATIFDNVDMVWIKIKKDFFKKFSKNNFLENQIEYCGFIKNDSDSNDEENVYFSDNQYPHYSCYTSLVEVMYQLHNNASSFEKIDLEELRPTFIYKNNLAIELIILIVEIIYGKNGITDNENNRYIKTKIIER